MITFKNYIKKYFPSIDFDFFERQEADNAIFPMSYDFDVNTEIPQIDYKPFDYSQETGSTGGGVFAENVADYIFQNYENAILTKYADKVKYDEETELYDLARTNLKRTIFSLMVQYREKWSSIWDTLQLDYDILDNVNEIFDETTNRTPDLSHTITKIDEFGQSEEQQKIVEGAHGDAVLNNYGAQSKDSTVDDNYLNDSTHTTENGVYPFDSESTLKKNDKSVVTDHMGDHQIQTVENIDSYDNSTSLSYGEQTTDTTNINSGHTDTSQTSQHEGGNEQTTVERRRHGNIGVTTSGQLIEDYKKAHDVNLIRIVAEDIANNIFTGEWECDLS